MFKQILLNAHLELWGLGTLVLFFGIFVAALLWVFRKNANDYYEHAANLPLD